MDFSLPRSATLSARDGFKHILRISGRQSMTCAKWRARACVVSPYTASLPPMATGMLNRPGLSKAIWFKLCGHGRDGVVALLCFCRSAPFKVSEVDVLRHRPTRLGHALDVSADCHGTSTLSTRTNSITIQLKRSIGPTDICRLQNRPYLTVERLRTVFFVSKIKLGFLHDVPPVFVIKQAIDGVAEILAV